jgi:three-Cys-motif partner protein
MHKHTQLGVEKGFFDHPREGSRVKQEIIAKYFNAYMNKMARGRIVGYADLFAGPGLYRTGEKSIPILACERAIEDERLRNCVRLWFNEADPGLFQDLKRNIASVDGISSLRFEPNITHIKISKSIAPKLEREGIPTLIFADPCGYKGLSLRLITAALKRFGNDCVFFFNYRRVNMKLGYPVMDGSINEFFEPDRADPLREEVKRLSPPDREMRVLAAIEEALREAGAFPLAFPFRGEGGGTSHHLVFASKNQAALGMMKRIMAKASSDEVQGVASFDFDPRDKASEPSNLSFFGGLYEVKERLLHTYKGSITFGDIIDTEETLTQYTDTNYRDALLELEADGSVEMDPPSEQRRFQPGGVKRTLPRRTKITFP